MHLGGPDGAPDVRGAGQARPTTRRTRVRARRPRGGSGPASRAVRVGSARPRSIARPVSPRATSHRLLRRSARPASETRSARPLAAPGRPVDPGRSPGSRRTGSSSGRPGDGPTRCGWSCPKDNGHVQGVAPRGAVRAVGPVRAQRAFGPAACTLDQIIFGGKVTEQRARSQTGLGGHVCGAGGVESPIQKAVDGSVEEAVFGGGVNHGAGMKRKGK